MGYWRITIDGSGCHHNNKRKIDADLAAKDFVAELLRQGHNLSAARMEYISDNTGKGSVVEGAPLTDFLAPLFCECGKADFCGLCDE